VPRVPVHSVDSAPESSRDALKQLEAKFGKVLNIHGGMAHSPALLHVYGAATDALLEHATLDAPTREAIHLTVATVNECGYCQAAYTRAGKAAGLSEEQTVAIRAGNVDFDDKLAALLEAMRQAAANRGYVSDDAWQAALDAGWSGAQLLEAFGHVVRTIMTNYFNHLVGTELDLPPAPPLDG
jgi:AhpD family alkylhydroperoxidase